MEKTANGIQAQIAFTKDYQDIGAQTPGWYPVETDRQYCSRTAEPWG